MLLTMSDLKRFFDNFYADPDKQKQDAYILKHCTPCKVSRRRPTTSKYANKKFQTKFYIYSEVLKKKLKCVNDIF